ncbi:MAG: hypothetical protein GY696_11270 [Gammaproteobacteria bacterium]|nr:hypothetical protein [Gammaproteobacteria bacterium]
MKNTLVSEFGEQINSISVPDLSEKDYKAKLKQIHTESVRASIVKMADNKVIQTKPPVFSKNEVLLPRTTRSTLAQLHSGYNTHLNTYQGRIYNDPNKIVSDKCPNCPEYHTTNHLPAEPDVTNSERAIE